MMTQVFPIQSIGRAARVSLLSVAAFTAILAVIVWSARAVHPVVMTGAALLALATAVLFLWFMLAQRGSRIEVSDSAIDIRIPLYGRSIGRDQIVPGSVRTVSVAQDTPYRLTWRTNALGVPGYQLGWFRSAGAGKILAALTTKNAIAFQTKAGFAVLLSVRDPVGLERVLGGAAP